MAFWRKKTGTSTVMAKKPVKGAKQRPRKADATLRFGTYALIHDNSAGGTYVFGMAWTTIVQSQREKAARAAAKSAKAVYYVAAQPTVGFARVSKQERKNLTGKRLYSAAQAFAEAYSYGSAVVVAKLPNGAVWTTVAKNGAVVIGTDRIFGNTEDAAAEGFSLDALVNAHGGRSQFQVVLDTLELSALGGERLPRALLQRAGDSTPQRNRLLLLLVLLLCVAKVAWDRWQAEQTRERIRAAQQMSIDPAKAWADALNKWQATTLVESDESFGLLLKAIGLQDTNLGGWRLQSTKCTPAPTGWTCSSIYARSRLASNATLLASLPSSSTATWDGLDSATVTFAVQSARVPISARALPTLSDLDQSGISLLQNQRRAYSKMTVQQPTPVAIAAPLDGAGRPVAAPPSGLTRLHQRVIDLDGPLRSAHVLPVSAVPLAITEFTLTVADARGVKLDLATSPLTVKINGVIYATQQ